MDRGNKQSAIDHATTLTKDLTMGFTVFEVNQLGYNTFYRVVSTTGYVQNMYHIDQSNKFTAICCTLIL